MAIDRRATDLWIVGQDDTVLDLRSIQGLWTEAQYFTMTDHSRRLLEFENGALAAMRLIYSNIASSASGVIVVATNECSGSDSIALRTSASLSPW